MRKTWIGVDPRLDELRPVLRTWRKLVERYCSIASGSEQNDAVFWDSERPNVGALAGAAWSEGWAALEEFHDYSPTSGAQRNGRVDLCIVSPAKRGYWFEAKIVWVADHWVPSEIETEVRDSIGSADRQMRKRQAFRQLRHRPKEAFFAISFVIPRARKSVDLVRLVSRTKTAIHRSLGQGPSACEWADARRNLTWREDGTPWHYRGVFAAIRRVTG